MQIKKIFHDLFYFVSEINLSEDLTQIASFIFPHGYINNLEAQELLVALVLLDKAQTGIIPRSANFICKYLSPWQNELHHTKGFGEEIKNLWRSLAEQEGTPKESSIILNKYLNVTEKDYEYIVLTMQRKIGEYLKIFPFTDFGCIKESYTSVAEYIIDFRLYYKEKTKKLCDMMKECETVRNRIFSLGFGEGDYEPFDFGVFDYEGGDQTQGYCIANYPFYLTIEEQKTMILLFNDCVMTRDTIVAKMIGSRLSKMTAYEIEDWLDDTNL